MVARYGLPKFQAGGHLSSVMKYKSDDFGRAKFQAGGHLSSVMKYKSDDFGQAKFQAGGHLSSVMKYNQMISGEQCSPLQSRKFMLTKFTI